MPGSGYDHSRVRLRCLENLFWKCVLPSALLAMALRVTQIDLGYLTVPTHIAFISTPFYLKTLYNDYHVSREAHRRGARPIPRVVGKWPGNVDVILRLFANLKSGYMQDVFLKLFHEYQSTTLNLRVLWTDKIITMDSEHTKYMFSTGFQHFSRGDTAKEIVHSFLGNGILSRDDEIWKAHRTLTRPFFAHDRVADFEIFEKHAQRVLSIFSSKGANEPLDFQDIIGCFTIDAASEFLFGQNLDTLSCDNADNGFDAFTDAFENMQALVLRRNTRQSFWPLAELFGDAAAPYTKTIRGWLDPIVSQALEHKSKVREMGLERLDLDQSTFLEYLVGSTDDVEMIKDQLINILLAARDTTSAALSFTVYLLAMHPDVTRKLRREILEHVGFDGIPTLENIRELKYLRAVLNETMRLFAPLPSNIRETRSEGVVFPKSDPTFPSSTSLPPLYVPPKTPVVTLPFLTQRNPALWDEDSEVFDPDRWIDPVRLEKFADNPNKFVPFSLGPRICLGQNYALNEISYFMIRLLQRFDRFTLAEDRQLTPPWISDPSSSKAKLGAAHPGTWRKAVDKIWLAYTITIHVKGGLWVRFGEASN